MRTIQIKHIPLTSDNKETLKAWSHDTNKLMTEVNKDREIQQQALELAEHFIELLEWPYSIKYFIEIPNKDYLAILEEKAEINKLLN